MSGRITRRQVRRLAVAAIVAAVVSGAVPAGAMAQEGGATCDAAANLTKAGYPQRALTAIQSVQTAESPATTETATTPPTSTPTAQPPACEKEEQAARGRIYEAQQYADLAEPALDDRRWADAAAAATQALALDKENADAITRLKAANAEIEAAAEDDTSAAASLKEQWDDFFKAWLAPAGALVLPWTAALLVLVSLARLLVLGVPRWPPLERNDGHRRAAAGLSGVAGLLTGATALTLLLADLHTTPATRPLVIALAAGAVVTGLMGVATAAGGTTDGDGSRLGAIGLLGLVTYWVGCVAAVVVLNPSVAGESAHSWAVAGTWGLGLSAGLLGVVLTAWWLATRLRLEVRVRDAEGKDQAGDAGAVLAHLNELGVRRPHGLEVPRGADVTALEGALSMLPESTLAKYLKGAITAVTGSTPWVATVETSSSVTTVNVSRNGHSVSSAVLDLEAIGAVVPKASEGAVANAAPAESAAGADEGAPSDASAATHKLAASFVLATLAREHPSIRAGLAGATEWRSIGLQYLASTTTDSDTKRRLLASAVDWDSANLAAQLAFRHALGRDSTTSEDLSAYAAWLENFERRAKAFPALWLRTVYTLATIQVNLAFTLPSVIASVPVSPGVSFASPTPRRLALIKARQSLARLAELLEMYGDDTDLEQLCRQMEDDLQGTRYLLAPDMPLPQPLSPLAMYNLGCALGSKNDVRTLEGNESARDRDDVRACAAFAVAVVDPNLRDWLRKDPQLTEFRKRPAYRRKFLTPPRDSFLTLAALKPFAEQLRARGLSSEAAVHGTDSDELALLLGTAAVVARHVRELATLCLSLRTFPASRVEGRTGLGPLARYAVEIVDQLEGRGLDSFRAIAALPPAERPALSTSLRDTLVGKFTPEGASVDHHDRRLTWALLSWLNIDHSDWWPA